MLKVGSNLPLKAEEPEPEPESEPAPRRGVD